ncbi:MAG TPA: diaminopimelate decarboxylase, partial [Halomonas sp.]|nr:diaminopimelate decarboxylase [Halomonas sp.]
LSRWEGGEQLTLLFEPGRSIAANAGLMLTRVEFLKPGETKNFAIVDAAMNDLIRPALYQAWQAIVPVDTRQVRNTATYDVVGPVCETGDFLGKERELAIAEGDLLAVRSAGAYGFVMASNYNSRPRPPEVMVDGDTYHVVRARETLESLWAGEALLPEGAR